MVQHQRAGNKGAFVLLTFMMDPRWCSKSSQKGAMDNGAICADTSPTFLQESLSDSIGMRHQ